MKSVTAMLAALGMAMLLSGCEQAREKKVLEIKTPGTSIEVRKSDDGAKVKVDHD